MTSKVYWETNDFMFIFSDCHDECNRFIVDDWNVFLLAYITDEKVTWPSRAGDTDDL